MFTSNINRNLKKEGQFYLNRSAMTKNYAKKKFLLIITLFKFSITHLMY